MLSLLSTIFYKMIKALFHNKLGRSIRDKFSPSEDSLTSFVFGLIQYLPSNLIIELLSKASHSEIIYSQIGELQEIEFWAHHNSLNKNNKYYVEPDVFMRFENADMLFEMKLNDSYGQEESQWVKEILSYQNEYSSDNKKLYFFAVGGNTNLIKETISIKKEQIQIFKISWRLLLNEVINLKKSICNNHIICSNSNGVIRILDDIIMSFQKHNYYNLLWFESFEINNYQLNEVLIFNNWTIENKFHLYSIVDNRERINNNTLNCISKWEI